MSKTKVLSFLTTSLVLGVSALITQPAVAGERWDKIKEFQQQKVQPFLDKHKIQVRGTYSPPRLPVGISCDTSGNTSVSFNPGVNTIAGRVGFTASRQLTKKCY